MDVTSIAVERDGVFQAEESATDLPILLTLPTPNTETFEANAPDVELARLAALGNISAFERLYERYHRRTYSLCLRMTEQPDRIRRFDAGSFHTAFPKVGSFRGESAFSTWLHRLTVNQVLMHFRRRSVKNEKTSEDGEMPEQIMPGTENQSKMPVLDRIALKRAIDQLPPGYRSAFVLHDVEGYEHEEVARILGISVGTSNRNCIKLV
jgi:RNA polymerase sigma-70 factor (ECF subfamily)